MSRAPPVDEATIAAVLLERYGVRATAFELLAGGLDTSAWTYRVTDDAVLRLTRGAVSAATVRFPRALYDAGVEAVVAPRPAGDGTPCVESHGMTWTVSPFAAGVDGFTHGMTDELWRELGSVLRTVHDAAIDPSVLALLARDEADASAYDRLLSCDAEVASGDGLFAATWQRHRAAMLAMLDQMHTLAGPLRAEPRPLLPCHGDLHPGNVLIGADGLRLLDWDCALLAPRERDFLFAAPPFFGGYLIPASDIDWVALTYYRCERVVQDVLEFAVQARDDEAEAERWLRHVFTPPDEAAGAFAAARRLPAHLDRLSC